MPLTETFDDALQYAAHLHRHQCRKGGDIPYISHLLAVAAIVIEAGGTEEEAIAALLHDAAEDQGGERTLKAVRERYGDRVAEIVRGCSDSLTEDPAKKPEWRERKERYIAHLSQCSDPSVYLVSAADKLHNARAILSDYRVHGEDLWRRFAGGREGTLWYYQTVLGVYCNPRASFPALERIIEDLKRTVETLEELVRHASAS